MDHPSSRPGGGFGWTGGGTNGPGSGMPAPPPDRPPVARWTQWIGAGLSGALILGVIVWGYRLAVRDVSGVPIIRALEGPGRIAPSDPGGDMAAHVGLAVNEVAGSGLAAPGPDRVVLAPPPTGLAPDDAPMADLKPLPDLAPAAPQDPEAAPVAPVPDSTTPPKVGAAPEAEPAPEPAPQAIEETAQSEAIPDTAIPADVPGLARSPRPLARPDRDLVAEAAAAAVAEALAPAGTDRVEEIDAASLPAGTRLVQINVYDSAEEARAYWGRVASRFEALMAGKKRIVQEATSGGRQFWRLRVAGFANVEEARQFCAALVAEGESCVPTVVK